MIKTMYKLFNSFFRSRISLLLIIVSFFASKESYASHATGSDLTYQSLGNGQYLVTFSFYRDCFGIDAPIQQTLNVNSVTCNFTQTYTMDQVVPTGQEITYNCSTVVSTCNGGSAPGIQEYEYTVIVTLPQTCIDWQFSTSVSARNAAVTTITNPDFENLFVDAWLNNTLGDNSSPSFSNPPIAFECIGQQNFFNHGVYDADGDSLVYSFIAPRTNANTPLTYEPGYSVVNPLSSSPPVNINSVNGDITMNPLQPEVAAMAVLIQEYRNGELIGTVMRDMQLYIVQCSNSLPSATGVDSTNVFNVSTCVGSPLCFDIISNDTDPNDILTMTWNAGIPGATFTVSGTPYPTGHFCWTPAAGDARPQPYTFTVTVRDNACPSNGVRTNSYSIVVSNMSVALTSTPSVQCFGSHNGSAMATASGNPPLTFTWTTPGGTILTGSSISHLPGGNYTLNVIDGTGCVGVTYFNIAQPSALSVGVTGVNAGCGGTTGSATGNPLGGTPNFSYLWFTTPPQVTQTATNLNTGNYTVRVTDSHGCSATGSVNIVSNTPVNFSLATTPATCLANDGTATVTHTGGTGTYTYDWTPNIPGNNTTASLSGLIAGGYDVIATDVGTGCSESLTGIVGNSAGISAIISAYTDASCQTSEDGSATVQASGGQLPYSYLWPNGDTTATTNTLEPGTYLAMVEDYNGCRAFASVTIGFNNPAPALDLGPDSTLCDTLSLTLDAGAGNSSYLWSDNSSGQTLTVSTSGTYSVLVTNSFGCENFDAITLNFVPCPLRVIGGSTSYNDLNIYPNPARDEINVHVSNIRNTEVKVSLTDILGNQVYSSKEVCQYGFSKKININSLAEGIYLMKVEYNGELNTSRIVKQ